MNLSCIKSDYNSYNDKIRQIYKILSIFLKKTFIVIDIDNNYKCRRYSFC